MKKNILLFLFAIVILSLVSCGKPTPKPNYQNYRETRIDYNHCVRYNEIVIKGEEFTIDVEKTLGGEIGYYTSEKDSQSGTYLWSAIENYTYELSVFAVQNEYKISQNKIVINALGNYDIFVRVIWDERISQMLWIGKVACYDPNSLVEIHNAEDLKVIEYKGQYILKNDIDLSSMEWEPLLEEKSFEGLLMNPEGYTIYNLHSAKLTSNEYAYFGLFRDINRAYIEGLKFSNISLGGIDEPFQYFSIGAIAGNSNMSTIKNCTVEGNVTGMNMVGGLVGHAFQSNFIRNTFIGNLEIANPDLTTSNYGIGGMAGCVDHITDNYCMLLQQCYVKANIKSDTSLGGMCGMNPFSKKDCTEVDCHFLSTYQED